MNTVKDIKRKFEAREEADLEIILRACGHARRERAIREAEAYEKQKKTLEAEARNARRNEWNNVFPVWGPRPTQLHRL